MSTPAADKYCIEDIRVAIGDYSSAMRTKGLPAFGGKRIGSFASRWWFGRDQTVSSYGGSRLNLARRHPIICVSGMSEDPRFSQGVHNALALVIQVSLVLYRLRQILSRVFFEDCR